jgi:hypothetical protein
MAKTNPKSTVLVISMGFLVIYLFTAISAFLYIAVAVGILGIFDSTSKIIDKLWMGLAKVLGYIIPNILLALIFYLILFPLALISKINQKDPLLLSPNHDTYWVPDEKIPDKKSFEKTW